jgi:hypothetical protein
MRMGKIVLLPKEIRLVYDRRNSIEGGVNYPNVMGCLGQVQISLRCYW